MPKCKICGDGVHAATIYHDECLMEAYEDMADDICTSFCRWTTETDECLLPESEPCPLVTFERKVFPGVYEDEESEGEKVPRE